MSRWRTPVITFFYLKGKFSGFPPVWLQVRFQKCERISRGNREITQRKSVNLAISPQRAAYAMGKQPRKRNKCKLVGGYALQVATHVRVRWLVQFAREVVANSCPTRANLAKLHKQPTSI